MTHLPHVRQGRTRELSQERLAGPDQARGWDDFGCNHTKSTSRLVTQLTSRSSRARFAVSDRTGPQRAGRLNSGVRHNSERSSRLKNSAHHALHLRRSLHPSDLRCRTLWASPGSTSRKPTIGSNRLCSYGRRIPMAQSRQRISRPSLSCNCCRYTRRSLARLPCVLRNDRRLWNRLIAGIASCA